MLLTGQHSIPVTTVALKWPQAWISPYNRPLENVATKARRSAPFCREKKTIDNRKAILSYCLELHPLSEMPTHIAINLITSNFPSLGLESSQQPFSFLYSALHGCSVFWHWTIRLSCFSTSLPFSTLYRDSSFLYFTVC